MADIFERLQRRPQQTKKPTNQQPKRVDLVARWARRTEIETFLKNLLANGPMSVAVIEELARARKFSKKQIWSAKQRIGAVAYKKKGKFDSGWLWSYPQNAPKQPSTVNHEHTRAIRDLAAAQGFRLRPIGKTTGKDEEPSKIP